MENHSYSAVIGNSAAPYENALASECGLATDYQGVTHPSLPNYLAATGGSTFGVSDDASPDAHPIGASSIFQQVSKAGETWRSYEESMPGNCALQSSGEYAVKHNPAAYFTAIRADCGRRDVPLSQLQADTAAGALPNFAFVTPNLCDDTHDCNVATGDAWLAHWVPRLLSGADYRRGDTALVITWDEGSSDQHIPTIVIAPSVAKGTRAGERFDHYSLLRTTEELIGLPLLGSAGQAPSMRAAFGL
jgi:phospholipase C